MPDAHPASTSGTRLASTFWGTAGTLAAYNLARALGPLADHRLVGAAALVAIITALARRGGLRLDDLGLAPGHLRGGARWGVAALGVIAVVLALVALIPATATFLEDPRGELSGTGLLVELAVGILVVTVIPEELAFRGVLLGVGQQLWGPRRATAVSSALFGLWHIAPTLRTLSDNAALGDAMSSTAGTVAVVAGSVISTAVAGAVFCWLRLRSRSLLAPVVAHLGTNGLALVAAWALR